MGSRIILKVGPMKVRRLYSSPSSSLLASKQSRTMALCIRRRNHDLLPDLGSPRASSSSFSCGTFISIKSTATAYDTHNKWSSIKRELEMSCQLCIVLIVHSACMAAAAKSSSESVMRRSRGPPASTSASTSEYVPTSTPTPSVATMRRPRLSTGTSNGAQLLSASHRPSRFTNGRITRSPQCRSRTQMQAHSVVGRAFCH